MKVDLNDERNQRDVVPIRNGVYRKAYVPYKAHFAVEKGNKANFVHMISMVYVALPLSCYTKIVAEI